MKNFLSKLKKMIYNTNVMFFIMGVTFFGAGLSFFHVDSYVADKYHLNGLFRAMGVVLGIATLLIYRFLYLAHKKKD